MRFIYVVAAVASASMLTHAQDQRHTDEHHIANLAAPRDPILTITINPEARVSVTRHGKLPAPMPCGRPIELPVKIINHGFVTTSLEVTLVDSIPEGVGLMFPSESLNGSQQEHRILRMTLEKSKLVDVTIAFRAKNDIPDLGNRDRIHLLLECT